jgi:hypothetical protein
VELYIDRGKTGEKPKNSGKKPVPVPLCPSQIPGLRGDRPATNDPSHGMVLSNICNGMCVALEECCVAVQLLTGSGKLLHSFPEGEN